MDNEELRERFSERIRENYDQFLKDWLNQDAEYLISFAEDVSATKMLAKALPEIASDEDREYLLQFENPLKMVRDSWMMTDSPDVTEEIEYTLSAVRGSPSLHDAYVRSTEPEQTQTQPGMEVTMC